MPRLRTSYHGRNILNEATFTNTGSEPITTADMKSWAKIDTSADDTLIDNLITEVIDTVERQYNFAIVDKDVTAVYEQYTERVDLPYKPVKSISSIDRLDEGTKETIESDDYRLQGGVLYIYEQYRSESRWWRQGLEVSYKAGWSSIPKAISLGLKQAILSNYEDREDIVGGMSVVEIPHGSKQKFNRFRHY